MFSPKRSRWSPIVFTFLSAHYHCLPNVSINRAFKNDSSNPEQKRNHFSTWKALNHFGISSNSFILRSKMCLSLGPKKYDKKALWITAKRALIYSCFLARDTWRHWARAKMNTHARCHACFFYFWDVTWENKCLVSRVSFGEFFFNLAQL